MYGLIVKLKSWYKKKWLKLAITLIENLAVYLRKMQI